MVEEQVNGDDKPSLHSTMRWHLLSSLTASKIYSIPIFSFLMCACPIQKLRFDIASFYTSKNKGIPHFMMSLKEVFIRYLLF